jgi:hypothetical protein
VRAGIGEIYLARVENFVNNIDPATIGFDAAVDFAPSGSEQYEGPLQFRDTLSSLLTKLGLLSPCFRDHYVIPYATAAHILMNRKEPAFKRFGCVSPMWDNSPRRKKKARILVGSTPNLYENWLRHTIAHTQSLFDGDERIIFINAWNEWAEGCHLEPDAKWGHAYLEATLRAINAPTKQKQKASPSIPRKTTTTSMQQFYWRTRGKLSEIRELMCHISYPGRYLD